MNERLLPGLVMVALIVVLLLLMWWAWRARRRRDASITITDRMPSAGITPRISVEVLYVATTRGGEPLERLALPGLAYRSRAAVTVADEGVLISPTGSGQVFIRASRITGAGPATWTIDRVVERDGLVMLRWRTDETEVDSYLRVQSQADHRSLLEQITAIQQPAADASPGGSETK